MAEPVAVELTASQAASLLQQQVRHAGELVAQRRPEAALNAYLSALGLALQLGPQPTELALNAMLTSAHALSQRGEAEALSAWGPAVVQLVEHVRGCDALPKTAVMEAWATVTADFGALMGQVGLALSVASEHGSGMVELALRRAELIDEATCGMLGLVGWVGNCAAKTRR